MGKGKLLYFLILTLLLCGCAGEPAPASTAPTVPETTAAPTVPETTEAPTVPETTAATEPPVYVYSGAVEDYLEFITYYTMDRTVDVGFTDAQYESLQALVADICGRNGIPMDRAHIIGHQDYSPRKTDPGELFDWERLLGSSEP